MSSTSLAEVDDLVAGRESTRGASLVWDRGVTAAYAASTGNASRSVIVRLADWERVVLVDDDQRAVWRSLSPCAVAGSVERAGPMSRDEVAACVLD